MIYFLKGKVELLKSDSIILNVNNVGYQIYVSHVDNYKINDQVIINVFNVIKEDTNYLIGFSSLEEKTLFMSLIKVNGLGPKTVISALRVSTPEEIKKAIECGNIAFLKKLPGIGDRAAYQIVLDMKGKLSNSQTTTNSKTYFETKQALLSLGFKNAAIERVLSSINDTNITVEQLTKLALQQLGK